MNWKLELIKIDAQLESDEAGIIQELTNGSIDPNSVDDDTWYDIFEDNKLPESFIEEFHPYVHWETIIGSQKPSENFIEKHISDINNEEAKYKWSAWRHISEIPNLSESFIEKYTDLLDWEVLSASQNWSEDFILKNDNKIYKEELLFSNPHISEELRNKLLDAHGWDDDSFYDRGWG